MSEVRYDISAQSFRFWSALAIQLASLTTTELPHSWKPRSTTLIRRKRTLQCRGGKCCPTLGDRRVSALARLAIASEAEGDQITQLAEELRLAFAANRTIQLNVDYSLAVWRLSQGMPVDELIEAVQRRAAAACGPGLPAAADLLDFMANPGDTPDVGCRQIINQHPKMLGVNRILLLTTATKRLAVLEKEEQAREFCSDAVAMIRLEASYIDSPDTGSAFAARPWTAAIRTAAGAGSRRCSRVAACRIGRRECAAAIRKNLFPAHTYSWRGGICIGHRTRGLQCRLAVRRNRGHNPSGTRRLRLPCPSVRDCRPALPRSTRAYRPHRPAASRYQCLRGRRNQKSQPQAASYGTRIHGSPAMTRWAGRHPRPRSCSGQIPTARQCFGRQPLENFMAMNRNLSGGVDPQANRVAFDFDHPNVDVPSMTTESPDLRDKTSIFAASWRNVSGSSKHDFERIPAYCTHVNYSRHGKKTPYFWHFECEERRPIASVMSCHDSQFRCRGLSGRRRIARHRDPSPGTSTP